MIELEKRDRSQNQIRINGIDGCKIILVSLAQGTANVLGWRDDRTEEIVNEMRGSTNEGVKEIFIREFGTYYKIIQ